MLFEIESEYFGGEVKVIRSTTFADSRGTLTPTFLKDEFKELGLPYNFVRDMESHSMSNVIRGLHFQLIPAMGKLMRVLQGTAFLVSVDLRWDSPTFLKYHQIALSEGDGLWVWASAEFARGFYTYTNVIMQYKCDEYLNSKSDAAIRWNDPEIGIKWPHEYPSISERDRHAPTVAEYFGRSQ